MNNFETKGLYGNFSYFQYTNQNYYIELNWLR